MKLALLIKVVDVKTSILPKRAGDKYFEENEAGQHAIHCQKVSGSLSKGLQLSPKPNSSSSSVAPFDAWQQEVSGKSSGYLQVNRTKGKLKIFSPTILNASQAAMLCHDFHVFKSSSFPQSKYSPFSFDTLCRVTAIVLAVVKSGLASRPDSKGNRQLESTLRGPSSTSGKPLATVGLSIAALAWAQTYRWNWTKCRVRAPESEKL